TVTGVQTCALPIWDSAPRASSRSQGREEKPRHRLGMAGLRVTRDAPAAIRTRDLRLRRPTLYPAELLAQTVGASGFEPPTSWSRTRRANRAALRPEHAPRRTRTPSLLIRSHVCGYSKRHAATRAVITRRTRPTVYRNRRAASRPARGTPSFTPTLPR